MKEYLWVIVAALGALLSFIFFIATISSTTALIKKGKKKKSNILTNIILPIIGMANIGIAFYLILTIKEQVEELTRLY